MSWEAFIYFAIIAVVFWITGAYAAWREKIGVAKISTALGLVVFFSFIVAMWISLERLSALWGRLVCGTLSSCL